MSPADLIDPADKSRQKSCNACVRSKRRCDKRTPRCTRCAEKNFSCVYQNLPPSAAAGGADHQQHQYDTSAAASVAAGQDDPLHTMDLEDGGASGPPPFDFNTLDDSPSASPSSYLDNGFPSLVMSEAPSNNSTATSTATPLDADAMPFDFNSVMDFLNADPTQGGEMQLWETPQPPVVPKTMAPELPQITMCSMEMERMCIGFEPWQVHEPGSRIGHLVAFIKDLPMSFAQTKQTPFLHRQLYRHTIPRPLMAAYTAISAYAGRTEANKDWAIRAICEGAAEILKGAKDATASSTTMTGHEKLARAQALWLIQAVRCFDGDIGLRAQAERDMDVLKRWVAELEGLRDNLEDAHVLDEPALRQRPPRSWEVWVFNECVRRTVVMGHIFMSLYELLQGAGKDEPDIAQWMVPHRWTFSRWLWEAQSSPAFFSAWREKPMFLVNSFFVQEASKVARPADVDEFARFFLTANFGVEETKHFMLEV